MVKVNKPQTISIAVAAKLVNFPGGEIKFFIWLRENGYLLQDNTPSQKYINLEWLVLVKTYRMIGKIKTLIPVSRFYLRGLAGIEKAVKKAFPGNKPCI
jgi:phage antirepressor YoqD-like protein